MRHLTKKHTLGKAKDQRDALLRALATELFTHGEIKTTMARAKALKPYAESIITMAKQDTVHARRQAAKHIYDKELGQLIDAETKAVVEKAEVKGDVVNIKNLRQGGYTRIYRLPPRRGDASEMALIQLV